MESKKNKGFIFTLDAIAALILVIALVSLFVSSQQNSSGTDTVLDSLNQKSLDKSIALNYFNQNGNNGAIGAKFKACNSSYYYDFQEPVIENRVKERKDCEEI